MKQYPNIEPDDKLIKVVTVYHKGYQESIRRAEEALKEALSEDGKFYNDFSLSADKETGLYIIDKFEEMKGYSEPRYIEQRKIFNSLEYSNFPGLRGNGMSLFHYFKY